MQVLGQGVFKRGAVELLLPAAHPGVPQKWGWCSSAAAVWHLAGRSGSGAEQWDSEPPRGCGLQARCSVCPWFGFQTLPGKAMGSWLWGVFSFSVQNVHWALTGKNSSAVYQGLVTALSLFLPCELSGNNPVVIFFFPK